MTGVEDSEDVASIMTGLSADVDADADAGADADAALAKSLAPTILVLVTFPSNILHRSLSASPLEGVAGPEGVGLSLASFSPAPRIRLVEVSKSR